MQRVLGEWGIQRRIPMIFIPRREKFIISASTLARDTDSVSYVMLILNC